MGLTPFACIPKQNDLHNFVRVVYPDGRIENLSRSCSVHELLQGNPEYYVCGGTANTITSRMGTHEQLERGYTYFVCAEPNAQPFLEFHAKTHTGWRIPSRREARSPSKVFDFHSATMQVESIRVGLQHQPRHLKLVFRQCLQSLRLPRNFGEPEPAAASTTVLEVASSSPSRDDVELVNALLNSAARSELGLYVSRRQEFYLRRAARRRRKALWKPVLQSISEMAPVVEFLPPPNPAAAAAAESQRFSPPRPAKNISPPRQPPQPQVPPRPAPPPRNISPPRQIHLTRTPSASRHQQHRRPSHQQRALYMA